jgi:hypothetical protein
MTVIKQKNPTTGVWEPIMVGGSGPAGPTGPQGPQGIPGVGVGGAGIPPGGATGQVLTKTSGSDYITAWQNKTVRSVKDFGAVGDGIADDAPAIQAAINATQYPVGGTVFLPNGNYRLNTGLIFTAQRLALVGEDPNSVEIRYYGNGSCMDITTDGGVRIENMRIWNTGAVGLKGIVVGSNTAYTGSLYEIRRVKMFGFLTNGLHVANCELSKFEDVYVDGQTATSIGIQLNASRHATNVQGGWNVMERCRVYNCLSYGWDIDKQTSLNTINCESLSNAGPFQVFIHGSTYNCTFNGWDVEDVNGAASKSGIIVGGFNHKLDMTGYSLLKGIEFSAATGCVLNPSRFSAVATPLTIGGTCVKTVIFDGGNLGNVTASNTAILNTTFIGRKYDNTFDITDFPIKGDGTTNDSFYFQLACDAVSAGQILRTTPGSTYYFGTEIQLRKDGAIYDFTGSTFTGPVAGAVNGGLITIGDRVTPAHIVSDVTVIGGHFRPQRNIDNGLSILCALRARCLNQTADMTNGQRGIALQSTTAYGGGSVPLKDIIIDGFTCWGGVNGVNLDTTGGNLISEVVIRDLLVLGAQAGIRLSAGTDSYRIEKVFVDNASLINCGTGVIWQRAVNSRLSNIDIIDSGTRGIDGRLVENNQWNDIKVSCSAGDGVAITLGDENTINNMLIKGSTSFGIQVNSTDTSVNDLTMINCVTALSTVDAMRTRWNNVMFEGCTTNVNAWRDSDEYTDFNIRDATAVTPLSRPARVITADRTLDITDANRIIEVNSASAISVTIPTNATVPFPIGTYFTLYRHGAGTVTPLASGGVTVRNIAAIASQYAAVIFRKRGTDEWIQSFA